MSPPANPAALALASLTPRQIEFLKRLPKAELHAHLNGSIPISVLQDLAREYSINPAEFSSDLTSDAVEKGLKKLLEGTPLVEISDFFDLFPSIYALTSTPRTLALATRAVLASFLDGSDPQCQYLELRSTPRQTDRMTREEYLRTIVREVEEYPREKVGFIVSLDRRMGEDVIGECVDVAGRLRAEGKPVVGVDLCGNPLVGDVRTFRKYFERAKEYGLKITLHIAETTDNTQEETLHLLSFKPDRLGHATFLDTSAVKTVLQERICIEICLSSNLLCKTVQSLDAHHIREYLKHNHPVCICTDDTLPFCTTLLAEYALLIAQPPLGLGLTEEEVTRIAEMSMDHRFI